MSIPVQTPFNLYIANGSTTVFPYRFLLTQASDLRVTVNGKTVSSGFSVSGEGNQSGGQVTFSTPPTNGTRIAILRNIPLRRDTEYQDNGDLLASTINADFDRLWMAVQGVDAATNLALSRSGQDVDYYDAKGMPVKNLKDPTDPQDAVTKNVLDSAVSAMSQQVNDAKTHLDVVNQSVLQNALKAQQAQVQVEQKIDEASKEVTEKIESQLAQGINTTTQNVASTKANADAAAGSAVASHQSEVNALGSEKAAGKHAQDAANILTQITLTESEIQQQATGVSSAKNEIDLKAAEVLQTKQDIDKNAASAKISETNSAQYEQGAKQALSEVKQEISAHGGIPGKSAYEIWKENQPAGADTSLTAFLDSMKGSGGVSMEDVSDYMNQYKDKYRLSLVGNIVVARWWPKQPDGPKRFPEPKNPAYGYPESGGELFIGYLTPPDFSPALIDVTGADAIRNYYLENDLKLPGTWEAMQYVTPGKVGLFIRTR